MSCLCITRLLTDFFYYVGSIALYFRRILKRLQRFEDHSGDTKSCISKESPLKKNKSVKQKQCMKALNLKQLLRVIYNRTYSDCGYGRVA